MNDNASGVTSLLLAQWLAIARRQWQLVAGVWIVVMALAVAILWALPRQFESTARFLVKNARQDLVVGPTDGNSVMYRDDVGEEIINTELELLRSHDILGRVVSELHLDKRHVERGKEPGLAAELAIRELGRGLSAATIRKTNLIQVSYMSPDSSLAHAVLKHLSDAYLEAHLVMHSSPGSYELFKRQGEDAERQLELAQQELAAMARSAHLLVPEEQKKDVMTSLNTAETDYAQLEADIQSAVARVRTTQQNLERVPPRVQSEVRNVPNQDSVDRLTVMIVEMRNRRTELLTKFNQDDRHVQEVEQQIADTTAALDSARTMSVDHESTNVNPTWVELEAESMRAQLTLVGLVGRKPQLQQRLEQYRARSLQLAAAMPQYEAVARRVAREQANYSLYTKKEEEARIVEALDRQRISNVVLAQAPFVSSVPAKPDVRVGLVIAVSTASALGGLAALAGEHLAISWLFLGRRRRSLNLDSESSPAAVMS